jgi:hypothetical protein
LSPDCDANEFVTEISMPLDRNIFWVGRQWAVTGLGVQAVDQRLKGAFDIEPARLWEDGILERMRANAWLNVEDFNKALSMARERFPEPPRKRLPLVESVLELMQPPPAEPVKPQVRSPEPPSRGRATAPIEPPPPAARSRTKAPIETPPAVRAAPVLALRIDRASAKFLPQWKVRAQGRSAG